MVPAQSREALDTFRRDPSDFHRLVVSTMCCGKSRNLS